MDCDECLNTFLDARSVRPRLDVQDGMEEGEGGFVRNEIRSPVKVQTVTVVHVRVKIQERV